MYKHLVLVTGMPRSGTSWLSQIFDSSPDVRFRLSPLFSYEFKNQANSTSGQAEWLRIFKGAYRSSNEFMNQSLRRKQGAYPTFLQKSPAPRWLVIKDTRFHDLTEPLLQLFNDIKVVALIRHPCGAINSWLQSSNEFPQHANPSEEWRFGECRKTGYGEFWGFEDWKKVTRMHLKLEKEYPDNFRIQRYEVLVDNATEATTHLFEFCGLSMCEQTRLFLSRSQAEHNPDQYAVFKDPQVTDRWRADLAPEIQQAIEKEVVGSELERFWA